MMCMAPRMLSENQKSGYSACLGKPNRGPAQFHHSNKQPTYWTLNPAGNRPDKWMELEDIILSEISQSQKNQRSNVFPGRSGISNVLCFALIAEASAVCHKTCKDARLLLSSLHKLHKVSVQAFVTVKVIIYAKFIVRDP